MKIKKMQKMRGFSLLELMVVLAIIGIMTAVVFIKVNSGQASQEMETASRRVAAQLRELQNDAVNGKQVSAGNIACQSSFVISGGAAVSYDLKYYKDCYDASGNLVSSPTHIASGDKTIQLKNVELSGTSNIYFLTPRGNSNGGSISIKSKRNSDTQSVCVNSAGNITEVKTSTCP